MINRDLVAVVGLVAAVGIMGGVLTNTVYQFTFMIQENEILKDKAKRLEAENDALRQQIENLQEEVNAALLLQVKDHLTQPETQASAGKGTLAIGLSSGVVEEKNVVIRNSDELFELWKEMAIAEPLPDVDFGSNIVIGVFYGEKSSLCYGINIDSVKQFVTPDEKVTAQVTITKTFSSKDGRCPSTVIQPFHVIMIPFLPHDVVFNSNEVTLD